MAKRTKPTRGTPMRPAGARPVAAPRPLTRPTRPVARTALRARSGIPVGPAVVIGVLVVAVTLVIGFALLNSSNASATNFECGQQVATQQGASVSDPMTMADEGHGHAATGAKLNYLNCPPTSGNHYAAAGVAPLKPGYYGPDAAFGPGSWVHNLEHAYVVVLYRCADGICPSEADVTQLQRFAAEAPTTGTAAACGYRSKVVVVRFDQMSTPYAMLAWDKLLLEESFDRSIALDFAQRWLEQDLPEKNSC